MNPLKHFGVHRAIRSDNSYNRKFPCQHVFGPVESMDHPNPGWQHVVTCKKCGYKLSRSKWDDDSTHTISTDPHSKNFVSHYDNFRLARKIERLVNEWP